MGKIVFISRETLQSISAVSYEGILLKSGHTILDCTCQTLKPCMLLLNVFCSSVCILSMCEQRPFHDPCSSHISSQEIVVWSLPMKLQTGAQISWVLLKIEALSTAQVCQPAGGPLKCLIAAEDIYKAATVYHLFAPAVYWFRGVIS